MSAPKGRGASVGASSVSRAVGKASSFVKAHKTELLVASNIALAATAYYHWSQRNGGVVEATKSLVFGIIRAVPGAASLVDSEIAKIKSKIKHELLQPVDDEVAVAALPADGWSREAIEQHLERTDQRDRQVWSTGKISGCIYHGGEELERLCGLAMARFSLSNLLHADMHPFIRQMDAEVVSMMLQLFNAPLAPGSAPPPADADPDAGTGGGRTVADAAKGESGGVGSTSSGGSESIMLALKAYRDYGRATKGITKPNVVMPETAHPAFDKGCHYFCIEIRKIPVNPVTFKADVAAMAAAMDANTVALVGSAVTFPQGVADPIPELSALAVESNVPLHVDSCLGSLLIPLARQTGLRDVCTCDFRLPGVTSISVDTHKFGYSPKGSSVVLYRDRKYHRHQFFKQTSWSGGIYASPTFAGSRTGAVIAATWVALMHHGLNGYKHAATQLLGVADEVVQAVRDAQTEGLGIRLYGEPDLAVVCFGPDEACANGPSIHAVFDALKARGWVLNVLQRPAAIHLTVTWANHERVRAEFREALFAACREAAANPERYEGGTAAMYGTAALVPREALEQVTDAFCEALTELGGRPAAAAAGGGAADPAVDGEEP